MEKSFRFLIGSAAFLAAVLGAGVSCSDDKTQEDENKGVVQQTWSKTVEAGASGETLEFRFTTLADWTARSSQRWCVVSPSSGAAGESTLTIRTYENTAATRSAEVTIFVKGYSSAKFTVQQAAGNGDASPFARQLDDDLARRYLWNEEYRTMDRDFSVVWNGMNDNFVYNNLMRMKTNTLDKKPYGEAMGQTIYSLYSSLTPIGYSSGGFSAAVPPVTRAETPDHGYPASTKTTFGFVSLYPITVTTNNGRMWWFCIEGVYPGSPAAAAGMKRGQWIYAVDGKQFAYNANDASEVAAAYEELLAPAKSGSKRFSMVDDPMNGSDPYAVTLTTETIAENTVLLAETIDAGGRKIAHLAYSGFEAAYDTSLLEAFEQFRNAGATEMVLDLRLNGGGHVISADLIASCIAGANCDGRVFAYYRYNRERMEAKNEKKEYDDTEGKFCDRFSYGSGYYGVDLKRYALGLKRLYVIVSNRTASASELVVNSLRGIDIDVVLIGERTEGKNVGMEGISGLTDGTYVYQYAPITFQSYNAKGERAAGSDYSKGFAPDYEVFDWNWSGPSSDGNRYFDGLRDFSDRTEPCLAKALELITGAKAASVPATRAADTLRALPGKIALPEIPGRQSGMIELVELDGFDAFLAE